jgi:hypothetical protein
MMVVVEVEMDDFSIGDLVKGRFNNNIYVVKRVRTNLQGLIYALDLLQLSGNSKIVNAEGLYPCFPTDVEKLNV